MSVLIKGGRIVTAADDYIADVFVEDETVTLIGESLDQQADCSHHRKLHQLAVRASLHPAQPCLSALARGRHSCSAGLLDFSRRTDFYIALVRDRPGGFRPGVGGKADRKNGRNACDVSSFLLILYFACHVCGSAAHPQESDGILRDPGYAQLLFHVARRHWCLSNDDFLFPDAGAATAFRSELSLSFPRIECDLYHGPRR